MSSIAIVHPMTLLGKELREQLVSCAALSAEIRLYSTVEEEIGTVTEVSGGAAFVNRWSELVADESELAIFCGELELDRAARKLVPEGFRTLTLSTGAAGEDGVPAVAGVCEGSYLAQPRLIAPAPSALLLARLLDTLDPIRVLDLTATAVHPVSESGQAGVDHLFEETRSVLSLSGRKKAPLYPAQVAFNLFPGVVPGVEIERQLGEIFGDKAPGASVQTLQAGLFHGVGVSASLVLEGSPSMTDLRQRFARSDRWTLVKSAAKVGTIDAAGADAILVGELRFSPTGRFCCWATMDNLSTGLAANARELAVEILGAGPIH